MLFGAAALALAAPASADWVKAESKHFVIYGDMPIEEMEDYATRLETFDAAARLIRSMKDPEVGDGNRVQVFVVPTVLDVNRLFGNADSGILGFYNDPVTGPFIITPRKARRDLDNRTFSPETVFFHEYTHHLQLQTSNRPMPAWVSEGFAEFLANPIFGEDGSIGLGTPASDRASAIVKGRWAPIELLLEGDAFKLGSAGFWGQNYAQGWLLNHYLVFEPNRRGQLDEYVKRITAGENPLDAARSAFGDLGQLAKELSDYRATKQFQYLKIDSAKLTIAPAKVTTMSPGAGEAMMMRAYAKTEYEGLPKGTVLKRLRDINARHPNDQMVLRTLAQAEYDNENYEETGAAADAALKINPNSTEAMLYKGRSILAKAKQANDPTLFKEARDWFVKANRSDKEDPEALYLYYRSFSDARQTVPEHALKGLHYAALLAPRDWTLQARLSAAYLRQGKLKEAQEAIKPVAYMPHAVGDIKDARKALDLMEAGNPTEALKVIEQDILPKPEEDHA